MAESRERPVAYEEHRQRFLALVLPFVAGALNAGGMLLYGHFTSHMSGTVSAVGLELGAANLVQSFAEVKFVLMFVAGAFVSAGVQASFHDRRNNQIRAALLATECFLLLLLLLSIRLQPRQRQTLYLPLLSFILGLQNTLLSTPKGSGLRTTHLTGTLTDIALLGARLAWRRSEQRSNDGGMLALNFCQVISFCGGAVSATQLVNLMGVSFLLVFALVLAAVSVLQALS